MTIVFDGSIFSRRMTGIGSNARNIVDAIIKYRPDIDLIIITPRRFHPNYGEWEMSLDKKVIYCPMIDSKIPSTLWYNFYTWIILKNQKADIFFTPTTQYPLLTNTKTKYIITVNDLVCKEFPETMEWKSRLMDFLVFDRAVKKAKRIWAISEYSHQTVCDFYKGCDNKKFFVGISVDNIYRPLKLVDSEKDVLLQGFGLKGRFILFVGSVEPRKNLQFLLKIAPMLYKATGVQTLIVGANQWGKTRDDYDKEAVVFVRRFVEKEDLVKLYNIAACYVSTSLNEGFGMPQLEAMKCGCPVVSPNNSAMTEVVSGYGTLVDGWDEETWINAIINEMGRDHTPYSGETYDWKHITDNFIKFCES